MLKGLSRRLRSNGQADRDALASEHELAERIGELTAANAASRSLERERELLRLRHRLGNTYVGEERTPPEPRSREFPALGESGLATVDRGELDGELVRGGIEEHGYVLVRGLIDRDDASGLADRIEDVFQASAAERGDRGGLFEEFAAEPPSAPIGRRQWITAGGGVLAADSPPAFFDLVDAFERAGLRRVISEFLDEPVTVSVQKSTLRRADPGPAGGWHQDGSFMGKTRALNVWLALSDCGVDAPGLEFVPRRFEDLVATGGAGSGVEHVDDPEEGDGVTMKSVLVGTADVETVAGGGGVMSPRFEPGDVMLFDDLFLHRTGADPTMTKPRYAIESWFFGASGFPRDYAPLAF